MPGTQPHTAWAVAGLLLNAFVWGLSWWPFKQLEALGLHPLWATAIVYGLSFAAIALWVRQRRIHTGWRQHTGLWWLLIASGLTNVGFNWAVTVGDVVRVVLLFYLMPVWAVLLAWWMLGERITAGSLLRVGLALAGAVLVLQPADGGWPVFDGLADWLGLAGGVGFALINVLLRQLANEASSSRALAMFSGGLVFPLGLGLMLTWQGQVPAPPAAQPSWMLMALGMGLLFVAANMALQHAAAKLPVRITSVIMLTEVLFAALTSVWWGGESLRWSVLAGGALILAAAFLAARGEH